MDAILTVMDDWAKGIDDKSSITAIFFDFAKAFDLVDHELSSSLPEWLISWIAAYLTKRKQRVKLGNIETEWKDVQAGVIQESVLGPILFILFIADINSYIPASVSTEKYADDILCYIIGKQTNNELPQTIADGIERWCIKNKMRLNAGKCKIIHIASTKNKHICPLVSLNNQELEQVDSYKYLGVELNKDLDWNQQWRRVQSLTSSVPFLVKQLKRLGFEERILINVYRSLVLSHFNYSSPILASTSAADKHEMQSFQKRILRIIGIKQDIAKEKYNIDHIEQHIEHAALSKLKKVLADPKHQLTVKLTSQHQRKIWRVKIQRRITS